MSEIPSNKIDSNIFREVFRNSSRGSDLDCLQGLNYCLASSNENIKMTGIGLRRMAVEITATVCVVVKVSASSTLGLNSCVDIKSLISEADQGASRLEQ